MIEKYSLPLKVHNCLSALYLAVPKEVADDVSKIVNDAIVDLQQQVVELVSFHEKGCGCNCHFPVQEEETPMTPTKGKMKQNE